MKSPINIYIRRSSCYPHIQFLCSYILRSYTESNFYSNLSDQLAMASTKAYLQNDLSFISLEFEDVNNVTKSEVNKIVDIFIANNVADLIMHERMIDKNTKNDVNKCVSVAMIDRLSNKSKQK